jgi:hypothetical protein
MSEVIEGTAGNEVAVYEGALLQPAAPLNDLVERFGQYAALCAALLDGSDFQPLKVKVREQDDEGRWVTRYEDKPFLKRSGWRKLATAMGVNLERLSKEIGRDVEGRVTFAEFEVRATAPNGRYADGWGGCSRYEREFSKPDHDIPATAETRAYSRACADLFGLGALSAEEVEGGDSPENGRLGGRTAPAPSSPPSQAAINDMHRRVRRLAAEGIWVDGAKLDEDDLRHRILQTACGKHSTGDLFAADMAAVFAELAAAEAAVGITG